MPDPSEWLLTRSERGNPATRLDDQHPGEQAWSEGNLVRPLIHGATYFAELFERIEATRAGDLVFFTDWQGDADERLTGEPGSEVAEVLGRADERGVDVRGLVWRSHSSAVGFTSDENLRLGRTLQKRGAEAILDMRVRTGGSHHQKLVVIRHRDDPARDIAYVGGIDLCHSRRDDADHHGDPQALETMAAEYGATPPWHDIQAAISGPAVHDVETVFRERWEDPTTLSRSPVILLRDRLRGLDTTPDPLPDAGAAAPARRRRHPRRPAAPHLSRTCAGAATTRSPAVASAAWRAATPRRSSEARHLIYVEDQYLWGDHVGSVFTEALEAHPDLHVIAVVPLRPTSRGSAGPPSWSADAARCSTWRGRRPTGSPSTGSRTTPAPRSTCTPRPAWSTTPGRPSAPTTSTAARGPTTPSSRRSSSTRPATTRATCGSTLAAEHLDRDPEDGPHVLADCVDAEGMFAAYAACAAALDRWHDGWRGRSTSAGPAPPTAATRAGQAGPGCRPRALPARARPGRSAQAAAQEGRVLGQDRDGDLAAHVAGDELAHGGRRPRSSGYVAPTLGVTCPASTSAASRSRSAALSLGIRIVRRWRTNSETTTARS